MISHLYICKWGESTIFFGFATTTFRIIYEFSKSINTKSMLFSTFKFNETEQERRERFLRDLQTNEGETWLPKIKGRHWKQPRKFQLESSFIPRGDQPQSISDLVKGINSNKKDQVLLGVTGSGKTFTMANVIQAVQKPTLIMAPNKTLASQLFEEMKAFFPHNSVQYFVSYYDYYQPEAYVPLSNTYIAKEATINDEIDRMRHAATRSLLERRDTIVVSSVSCIYGLGSPEDYDHMVLELAIGEAYPEIENQLQALQYESNPKNPKPGTFRRIHTSTLEIFPPHREDIFWLLKFDLNSVLVSISTVDTKTHDLIRQRKYIRLYPNSHYILRRESIQGAVERILKDMGERYALFMKFGKKEEAKRLEERTKLDVEMILKTGSCKGIENYTRYFTGRPNGAPPPTLAEYMGKDSLLFVDESHITVPQIGGMFRGDFRRKWTLAEYGFRLPSCADNRPLKFCEWEANRSLTIHVSATPGKWELNKVKGEVVNQIVRPTGLLDPICQIKPAKDQIKDLLAKCRKSIQEGKRVIVTTLTKIMAENISEYFQEQKLKVNYLHSDVCTLDRVEIIKNFRRGVFDILIGINLLREGLDIPECGLVAILDADKEGFLRSETSLTQTMGRAARHKEGRVILYADSITPSMNRALEQNKDRRKIQEDYNKRHNIEPTPVGSNKLLEWNHIGEDERSLKKELKATEIKQGHSGGSSLREKIIKVESAEAKN